MGASRGRGGVTGGGAEGEGLMGAHGVAVTSGGQRVGREGGDLMGAPMEGQRRALPQLKPPELLRLPRCACGSSYRVVVVGVHCAGAWASRGSPWAPCGRWPTGWGRSGLPHTDSGTRSPVQQERGTRIGSRRAMGRGSVAHLRKRPGRFRHLHCASDSSDKVKWGDWGGRTRQRQLRDG